MRRALEFRGRAFRAKCRANRPHAALWLPSRLHRQATLIINVAWTPRELNEWGALGGIVGRLAGDYWQVPALIGLDRVPGSDEMKHFGAALASYGSVALFHMVGITPEAQRLDDVVIPGRTAGTCQVGEADIRAFHLSYIKEVENADVVVFSAPQLSLVEMQQVARLLDGRRATIPLLVVTSPQVKPDADRMGLTARIEQLAGPCSPACASTIAMLEKWLKRTVGNGWRRTRRNDQHHRWVWIQAGTALHGRVHRDRMRRRQVAS